MCNKGIFFSISYMPMHDIFDCAQMKNSKENKEKEKRIKILLYDCKRAFQLM